MTRLWEERWGLPIVSVEREYLPAEVEGLVWRDTGGTPLGLVIWCVEFLLEQLFPGERRGSRIHRLRER